MTVKELRRVLGAFQQDAVIAIEVQDSEHGSRIDSLSAITCYNNEPTVVFHAKQDR